MPERNGYIPGVPCWVDTSQPDPSAAIEFYAELFGWEFENVMPPGAPGEYSIARIRGGDVAAVGSIPEGFPPMATWNTYIWVDDADRTAELVREAGGAVLTEPFDVMDSGRMAVCADPEGAMFGLWQANQHRGARIVNEHGSVNFNNLRTRDADAAKTFYGAVFGWGTLDVGSDADMWTLPGYGDHLEELTPGIKEGMAQMGAPPGFVDVVAALHPIPDDDKSTSPCWTVTFAVDDADAIAARAPALGATVLAPPVDAPWVRMTILEDPQGASFVASQFVAENKDLAG